MLMNGIINIMTYYSQNYADIIISCLIAAVIIITVIHDHTLTYCMYYVGLDLMLALLKILKVTHYSLLD